MVKGRKRKTKKSTTLLKTCKKEKQTQVNVAVYKKTVTK